jgi:hypothetical protein
MMKTPRLDAAFQDQPAQRLHQCTIPHAVRDNVDYMSAGECNQPIEEGLEVRYGPFDVRFIPRVGNNRAVRRPAEGQL